MLDGHGGLEGSAEQLLVPWMLHLMPGRAGSLTVARAWRRDERPRLTDDEVALLDAYEAAWISPWEIADVEHGVGATLTDPLTGEKRFAHDVRASSTLEQFDSVSRCAHRGDNTIVGRIVVSATRLRAETNSARRADSLRAALESHLQGSVRFRLRKEENTAQLITEARESPAPPMEREPLQPDALAAVREFRERQMAGWIGESIPALGGRTPLQAAGSPKARAKLATLLRELVQNEARLPEEQRIDLGRLRSALGFNEL